MNKNPRIQNHQVIGERSKGNVFGTNLWKIIIPKESIKTQKVTNAPNLIVQSKTPAPKDIMVDKKI